MRNAELLIDIGKKLEAEYRDTFQELGEEIGKKILEYGYVEDDLLPTKQAIRFMTVSLEVILHLAILDTVDPNYYMEV